MRKRDYQRAMLRRIHRAEAEAHASILRAFDKVIATVSREATEYRVYLARHDKKFGR